MGTESLLCTFSGKITDVFGNWVVEDDARLHRPTTQRVDDVDDLADFHMQPEPTVAQDFSAYTDTGFDIMQETSGLSDAGPSIASGTVDPSIPGPVFLDCRGSIFVAGALHIIANITEDLSKCCLAVWSEWLEKLRHVCKMLRRKHLRDRLFESCFDSPALRLRRADLSHFSGDVYEGRWSSVAHAVGQLLPHEQLLRQAWRKDAYLGKAKSAEARDASSVQIDIVDGAIGDPLFWAYGFMIHQLATTLETVAYWSEGCMCHTTLNGPRHAYHQRARQFEHDYGVTSCPMRTMQAPSFAAGRHFEVLDDLLNRANAELVFDRRVAALNNEERSALLTDWSRGRAHLVFSFRVKLSFWRQLPWVFCGLGHPCLATARACAARALALYKDSPPTTAHHCVTERFCNPAGGIRASLEDFSRGAGSLQDNAELELEVSKLRFVAVSERSLPDSEQVNLASSATSW